MPPRLSHRPLTTHFSLLLHHHQSHPPRAFTPSPYYLLLLARPASHASEGRANKAAQGPGRRLGAKKGASELVVPGNIIFRQRGTHWFPGENCGMGRDHTIFAREKGFVTYYRDEERFPGRKYIGVVFRPGDTLPRGRNEARRRRLGLCAATILDHRDGEGQGGQGWDGIIKRVEVEKLAGGQWKEGKVLPGLKKGYTFRKTNFEIGRAAEKSRGRVVLFKPGDRFKAWRKRVVGRARGRERKTLTGKRKK